MALVLFAGVAYALSYTIAIQTNSSAYVGAATVQVSGQVSPAPGPNTAVLLRVLNPNRVLVTADQASVNGTTGLFSATFVAGGTSTWIDGTYVLNATWGAYGPTIFSTSTFSWSSHTTTTTTTSTTTSTSATTSPTSTTSSAISTSVSTTNTTSRATSSATSFTSSSASASTSISSSSGASLSNYLIIGAAAVAMAGIVGFVLLRRKRS